MCPFHLILFDAAKAVPRRVDFEATSPDHAFQIARNESDGVYVELWEGSALLARMTKSGANIWQLLPLDADGPDACAETRARVTSRTGALQA